MGVWLVGCGSFGGGDAGEEWRWYDDVAPEESHASRC